LWVLAHQGKLNKITIFQIIPSETQIVYLPAGSMDTILIWERVINDGIIDFKFRNVNGNFRP
jgi:hypothetical protein